MNAWSISSAIPLMAPAIRAAACVVALLVLSGCSSVSTITTAPDGTTIEQRDGRCIIQSHCTVVGVDLQVFDVLFNGQSSPTKVRFGYVSSDQQITPIGAEASLSKKYNLEADSYDIKLKTKK